MDEEDLIAGKFYTSPRTTRSNKTFSPWEVYPVHLTFDFASRVQETMERSLKKELNQSKLAKTTISPFSSPLTTPENTPPSSPSLDPTESTAPCSALLLEYIPPSTNMSFIPQSMPLTRTSPMPTLDPTPPLSDDDRRKERRKASRASARRKRREVAASTFGAYQVRESILHRYVRTDGTYQAPMKTQDIEVPKGGFVGRRDVLNLQRIHRLEELVGPGSEDFTLLEWDGIKTICLVGQDKRLVGILAGTPGTDDWPQVVQDAADALEACQHRCVVRKGKKSQFRRGEFTTLACSVSYGGGQTHPMNVANLPPNAAVLAELNNLKCFQRISGFSSSILASRAPALYEHYAEKIRPIYEDDPTLERPFANSIFSATTYNLGPQTVCYPHLDNANLAYGKCSITPLGKYDHKRGSHLVLWECRLVIEFPPGSTALIPSAVITHSNTAISPSETRYSFTQYTSGALFRWVENSFMTAENRRALLTETELARDKEKDKRRWKEGLSLIPVLD